MSQTSEFLVGHRITDVKIMKRELFVYLDNGGIYLIKPYINDPMDGDFSFGLDFQIIRKPHLVYAKAETAKLNK